MPQHVSGRPDSLPFKNLRAVRNVFKSLDLPLSYFQIADGSLTTAQSYTIYDQVGQPVSYELIAHCLTKQGNWAMALSHNASSWLTSVFWAVDDRVDSKMLTEHLYAFQECAFHPVLIPCIMFAAAFQMTLQRRHSIKDKLQRLESAIKRIDGRTTASTNSYSHQYQDEEAARELEHLFELLHSCRSEQASRKGRYDFWQSYYGAIEEGMKYAETILAVSPSEERFKAHSDLRRWTTMTWQRVKSLEARDKDHVNRVDNASYLVCINSINEQYVHPC